MRSYEIQVFKDSKWKMDSVYDDRNLALDEAKRADEGNRYAGIRVIEEDYDEETNLITSRTLFRGGIAKENKTNKPEKKASPKRSASRSGREKETSSKRKEKPQAKKSNFLVPCLVLLIVVLGGAVALFGIEYLATLK